MLSTPAVYLCTYNPLNPSPVSNARVVIIRTGTDQYNNILISTPRMSSKTLITIIFIRVLRINPKCVSLRGDGIFCTLKMSI